MTEEERTLLATVIMGWHIEDSCQGLVWCDGTGMVQSHSRDWRPDQDIEQAMQLVDALRSRDFDCSLGLLAKSHGEQCYCRVISCIIGHAPVQGGWEESWRTPSSAIAVAALKVAKAMKKEESDG